MVIMIWVS